MSPLSPATENYVQSTPSSVCLPGFLLSGSYAPNFFSHSL